MANKPKYFDIEDSVTGKIYRVETDAEDATYEEAASYLESLPEDQWTQFEYNPSVPSQQASQQAPAAPVRSGSVAVSAPQEAPKQVKPQAEDYQLGMDTFGDLSPEVNTLSTADQKVFLGLANDPNISEDQLDQFLVARGIRAMTPEEREASAAQRQKIFSGEALPYDRVVQDSLFDDMALPKDVTSYQEKGGDGFFDQIGRSAASAWADPASLMNYLDRTKTDLFDVYADEIAKQFPDATPEELDALEEQYIGYIARRRSEAAEAGVAEDDFAPWLIGQFLGIEPYDIVPIGRAARAGTKVGRAFEKGVEGAGVAAIGDVVGQGLAIADDAQAEFDPLRTLGSAGLSGVIAGGVQGAGDVIGSLRAPKAADTTAGQISVPTGNRRTKAYKEEMGAAIDQAVTHINDTTKDWTNKPAITVHNNFAKLQGIERKALGVYMADGTIALNLERIGTRAARLGVAVEDVINATLFHESLGHFALNQKYGEALDSVLDDFYTNGNTKFQDLVDEWLGDNPKQYANGDPRGLIEDPELYRRIRATEEVMARWAENEGVIPKTFIDTITNMVKNFARQMGLSLSYSKREIKSLLGVAQREVTRGQGTDAGTPGSPRYMYIGRQELENNKYRGTQPPVGQALLYDLEFTQDAFADEIMMATPEERPAILQKYSTDGESRLSSGWFIGPDKKWRFEISDEGARLLGLPRPGEEWDLDEVLEHAELFELYQNIGEDITVTTEVMPSNYLGSFNPKTGKLTLNATFRDALYRNDPDDQETITKALSTVLHEVQHGIQDIEGFAVGGSDRMALKNMPDSVLYKGALNNARYMKEVEAVESATILDAVDELKQMREYIDYERELGYADRLYKELENLRSKYSGLPYRELNEKPDVKLARDKWHDQSKKATKFKRVLHAKLGLPEYILPSEGLTQKAINFYNEMMWVAKNQNSYRAHEETIKRLVERSDKLTEAVNKKDRSTVEYLLKQDDLVAFDAYEHLFGEVEARDVEARMKMTDDERRATAPYSATGIKPENYAVTFDGRGPANSITPSKPSTDRIRLKRKFANPEGGTTGNVLGPVHEAAKTFLAELQVFSGGELYRMNGEEAIQRAERLGIDQEWLNYYNDSYLRSYGEDAPNTPQPDMSKYMPEAKYMMDDEEDRLPLSDDDIFEMMNAKDIINELRSGYTPEPRSWGEVKRQAALTGLKASDIRKIKGVGDVSARLYQYDKLQEKLNEKVTTLYNKMQNGGTSPQIKAQYLETMFKFKELTGRIFEDQAEVGRALNFMKQLGLTRRKLENINDLLAQYGGQGVGAFKSDDLFKEFADQVQYLIASGNPAGAATLVRQIDKPYWWQYILSARHAMMLSGMGTHAKNAYDGLMVIAREMEETLLAVPGFYVRKGLQSAGYNVKDGVSPQEAAARAYGLLRAALDAQTYTETWNAFKQGHQSRIYSAKIEMQDARIPYLSKVNDALYASDTFFRSFHTNANLYSLGVRKARQDGFTGMRALEEGTANAMSPTIEMINEARRLTDTALLVDSPSGISNWAEAAKAIRPNMTAGEQARAFFFNIVFPFLRVTDRLLFQAIRRSPLSVLDKNTRAEWEQGGAARDIAVARTLFGSALIANYWVQAGIGDDQEGDVEGAGPLNYKKRQSLEATGYRPNSRVEDGNMVDVLALNLSLNPLGTDNAIAAQIASIREAWERGAKGETETEVMVNGITETTRALLGVLASQSYAENLSVYLDPVLERDPSRRDSIDAALVGGAASQFVPAAARQVTQMVLDPERKVTTGDGSFADRVYGRVASGIPVLSEGLPDRVDALGDTMPQGRTLFGIGNFTEIKKDDVSKEIRKLDRETTKPMLANAPSSFQLEGRTVRLTAEQQQKWNTASGKLIREVMSLVIANPKWATADKATKVALVKELREEAYKAGKLSILGDIDFRVQVQEEEL